MIVRVSPGLKIEPLPTGGALVFNATTGATSLVNDDALRLLELLQAQCMWVSEERSAGANISGCSADDLASLEKSGLVVCS